MDQVEVLQQLAEFEKKLAEQKEKKESLKDEDDDVGIDDENDSEKRKEIEANKQ